MAKHVIFFGAGASYTSGYPLAADLRKILSSSYTFGKYLEEKITKLDSTAKGACAKWFSELSSTIELFREGGFGTVDEFSYLARKQFPQQVHEMKQLVGLILALHNPETLYKKPSGEGTNGFENSDYYPFIQRLFRERDTIRDDVAILSYNYDPYFEFLLNRAYDRRKYTSTNQSTPFPPTELTSGFADRDAEKIAKGKGFCFLKLHGTCVLPIQFNEDNSSRKGYLTFADVFKERDKWLASPDFWSAKPWSSPAMYFPWELLNDRNEFVIQDEFNSLEALTSGNLYFKSTGRTLHKLCTAIWRRAQTEIAAAETISFVGLSMHEFLKPGLRYLFAERVRRSNAQKAHNFDNTLIINLACPNAWSPGEKFTTPAPPSSPAAKLAEMLREVNPNMASPSVVGKINSQQSGKNAVGGIMCYDDFKGFIEGTM